MRSPIADLITSVEKSLRAPAAGIRFMVHFNLRPTLRLVKRPMALAAQPIRCSDGSGNTR